VSGLLFVCLANRARSPLAELMTRALLDQAPGGSQIAVSSAGTWTPGGEPMWPPAAAEATRLGLDPTGFRSRQLTPDIADDVDVVLAATRDLRDKLISGQPSLLRRCFTWRELAWNLAAAPPAWDGVAWADRLGALPEVVARSRGRIPAPPADALDVEDPGGRRPKVLREASAQTLNAVRTITAALSG